MTERQHPANAAANQTSEPSDALLDLYRDASSPSAGPSALTRARVLAYARERAAQSNPAAAVQHTPTTPSRFSGEPANDRRWLRHALGGLAVLGVAGWLAWLTIHPLAQPDTALHSSAPTVHASRTEADAQPTENLAQKPAYAPNPPAQIAIKSEATKRKFEMDASQGRANHPTAVAAQSTIDHQPDSQVSQTSAASAPSAPSATTIHLQASTDPAVAEAKAALPAAAPTTAPALPMCNASMSASAQREQARRIAARQAAQAAGAALPQPAPTCRPSAHGDTPVP